VSVEASIETMDFDDGMYIRPIPFGDRRYDFTCRDCGVFRTYDRQTCYLYSDRREVKTMLACETFPVIINPASD
jgi:hypothetical protein